MNNLGLRKLQVFCAGVAALCGLLGAGSARGQVAKQRLVTEAVDDEKRMTLHGNVHPLARAEFDQGAIADSLPVNRIYLLLNRGAEQQAALDKLMLEQVDQNSPNFHKWLTPEEYGTQFGPSEDDIAAVKSWLSSHGFTGIKTNAGRTIVEFNGTVGSVRNAFSTDLHRFVVRGEEHFANVSDPKIPAALAKVVVGIPSLHNFRKQSHVKRFGKFRRDDATGEIRPLLTFTDVNGTFFGMGPADFAKIYNIPAGADGTGQSIAIVGRSNINIQDVRDFRTMFGLPANDPVIILNGADPGLVSGDEGEADLDVEWSGAVAPKATIKFVVSEEEQTTAIEAIDASAQFIIDNNIAPVMSVSFGLCEAFQGAAGNALQNAMWQQAAAEGITVSVSAGDNGSAGCDDPNAVNSAGQGATAQNPAHGISVSGTASTPFNVAVGGTDFDDGATTATFWDTCAGNPCTTTAASASAKGYIPEIPWNDSCAVNGINGCAAAPSCATTNGPCLTIVAGSGGPSAVYAKPTYQSQGIAGMPADGQRDIPDISLFAADGLNKSFYIICESDQDIPGDTGCNLTKFVGGNTGPFHDFQTVGGTSASAPAFAGIMALVNQKTGQRQGNANFVLYALAKNETFANCNSSNFTNPANALPSACVFIDVTKSNNAVPCVGGSPNCSKTSAGGNGVLASGGNPAFASTAGYDLATGLGSINVTALLANWVTLPGSKTTVTVFTTAGPITTTVGSPVSLSGTVTSTGGTPTGVVTIESVTTGEEIGTVALSGNNFSLSNSTFFPGGSYSVRARYGGDGIFLPSPSPSLAINSTPANSKVLVQFATFNLGGTLATLDTNSHSVPYGSPYIVRVDVANGAGTPCENVATGAVNFTCPTGQVALFDGGVALNDFFSAQTPNATNIANLNNRGFVEDQPIQLNAGVHNIRATYTGDASYNAPVATSNILQVTITQAATQTTVVGSPSAIISGGNVTLTATVATASNSSQGPTGTVQFSNGAANLGAPVMCNPKGATATVGASCTATLATTLSAFAPIGVERPWRWTPLEWAAAAMLLTAIVLFVLALRMRGPRRGFAYGAMALFLIASATLAGCGGGSSGGGGNTGKLITITAKYSGDTNYAAGTPGTTTVSVQ